MSYAKTKYTGPVKDRGRDEQGRALVSREELEDFRRKFGPQMTLRDLLNADKGRGPSAANPAARGVQEANIKPAGPRVRPDETATLPAVGLGDVPGLIMRGMAQGAERVPAGRGAGAAFVGAGLPRALTGAYRAKKARDAAEALRRLDEPAVEAAQRAGAERRAMSTLREGLAKDLAEDISSGSVGRGTPMKSTATTSETGRRFTPAQEMEAATSAARGAASRKAVQEARTGRSQAAAEAKAEKPILRTEKAKETPRSRTRENEEGEFKRGGKVKTYSKGGVTRADGCAQRGKTRGRVR